MIVDYVLKRYSTFNMARLFNLYKLQRFLNRSNTCDHRIIKSYKSFHGEKVTEIGENTLTGRLLMYLNNINMPDVKRRETAVDLNKINHQTVDLNHYDIDKIKAMIKNLDIGQIRVHPNLLDTLDIESTKRLKRMKTADIFEILYMFMKIVPHRIIEYKFYENAVKELSRRLHFLNKSEVISLIFYIGLRKKMTRHRNTVRVCLKYLNDLDFHSLTAEDLCVICNSTFKTTTRITSEAFLSKVITYLNNNLYLFKDPALLITFLKSIRHNRYQDDDLLSTLSCTIFFNNTLQLYSFSALSHILAVYSDYLYYDESILRVFTERCLAFLKQSEFISKHEHPSAHIRLKDIKRLLWCLSNLNYKGLDTSDIKNVIIPNIIIRVKEGDVENDFSSLIEITLYLWMLNYRAYELVPYFLNKKTIEAVNQLHTPIKQRLNLLITCMFFEERELLKGLNEYPKENVDYNMSNQLEKRLLLKKVIKRVKDISKKHELNRFEVNCQVPGINIIGLCGYRKNIYKTVHIEVLDEYTTLKNTENMPTGLMQLKLRLLDLSEEAVILIHSDEIGSMNDAEIEQVLLEEIEFVC